MSTDLVIRDERHYLATVADVRALAERIETVGDARDLADRARAAQVWAQRAKLGTEQVNLAAVAKLWAERRAGELLRETPKNRGAQGVGKSAVADRDHTPTLGELGVTKHESSRWQRLAAIPAEQFTEAVEQATSEGAVSTARVTALAERGFEERVRDEFFPAPTPVFDAFWKACGLLIRKATPEAAAAETWDGEMRDMVRRWAPEMVNRLNELAALVDEPGLRVVEGGRRANH